MDPETSLQNYRHYYSQYERCKAQGHLDKALKALEQAISACPVTEALDYLSDRRKELREAIEGVQSKASSQRPQTKG